MTAVAFSDDDVDTYDTRDEAIAAAMLESEDGDEVLVHAPTCEMGRWADEESAEQKPCSCTPDVHVVRRAVA